MLLLLFSCLDVVSMVVAQVGHDQPPARPFALFVEWQVPDGEGAASATMYSVSRVDAIKTMRSTKSIDRAAG